MWKYNNTDELYHFGIPGMRWGHRKAQIIAVNNGKKKSISSKKKNIERRKKKNIERRKKISKVLYNTAQGTGYAAKKLYLDPMTKDMRTTGRYVDLAYQMSPEYKKRFM